VNGRRHDTVLTAALSLATVLLIAVSSVALSAVGPDAPAEGTAVESRWLTPKASNVPMAKLGPGEQAPQFVIFSFDGAGSHEKMDYFLAAAEPTDSRLTGFLSGTYLLTDTSAAAYRGPGASPGTSSIGFGGDLAEVTRRVADLNNFYALGNEIGTHYNGHFCGLVGDWSTADWNSELDQFYDWFGDWKAANGLADGPELRVPPTAVKGGRTPCLAGRFDQLTPAWVAHSMTYDSSGENDFTGIAWPEQRDGVWQFPIPTVYAPAFAAAGYAPLIKPMDYNFWHKFNGAKEDPASQPELTAIVLDTYRFMYEQAYAGNRAPIIVANHFNDWNGNAFNPAAHQFLTETCGQPDTICTTYQDVIAWMELQDPEVLAGLQARPPVADTAGVAG
jgi:hypothetical protein